MANEVVKSGGRYASTFDYTADKLGIKRPYIPGENRIVKAILEAALESGIGAGDAVKLAIGVYKEIDVLARNEKCDILSRTALKDIRTYCRAILRSGTTFSSFEIAQRAVMAWRELAKELVELHKMWDRESVTHRLKERKRRQELAAELKERAAVADRDAGHMDPYTAEGFDEMSQLDWEADGKHGVYGSGREL
jgi:hypothetical protein